MIYEVDNIDISCYDSNGVSTEINNNNNNGLNYLVVSTIDPKLSFWIEG